jgi:phosphate-selective porin OprO/OprP
LHPTNFSGDPILTRPSWDTNRGFRRWAPLLALAALPAAAAAQAPATDTLALAAPHAPPAPAAPAASAVTAIAGTDGFGLRSADGAFVFRLQGGAQYDGRYFADDAGGGGVDGFEIRRLRTDLRGTLYRDYDFRVNLEYAGNRVEVQDAYIDARLTPAFQVQVGKFKVPVSLGRLQSVWVIPFAEFAYPSSLAPNRDVGIQLHGSFGGPVVSYSLGVFNGVPDGASGDTDLSDSKDVVGRLFVQPFARTGVEALRGLGLGLAGSAGRQNASLAAPGLPAPRTTLGRTTFLGFRSDGTAAGTVLADGNRTRLSPQGYWYWKSVGVLGEYIRTRTEVRRDEETARLDDSAWQVTGTWVVTGEKASYRGVTPAHPVDPARGGWGAWEAALRFQSLRTDASAFPLLADPARSAPGASGYTAGVNWYLNGGVRILADYEHTHYEAAPGAARRPSEGVFVTRFQLAF